MNDCIFCKITANEVESLKVYEDEKTLAFMDIAKDVDGHILVIPKKHVENILDCDPETLQALTRTVKLVADHLINDCGYDGINLLNASGKSAGQSVYHFHIHLIPRKDGDGIDVWPKFSGAKEDLLKIYEQVRIK